MDHMKFALIILGIIATFIFLDMNGTFNEIVKPQIIENN